MTTYESAKGLLRRTFPPIPDDAKRRFPLFDRFAILFLAVDWIVFGSMHFSYFAETLEMLPDWGRLSSILVSVAGVAEVATGIALLYPRVRRAAAASSLLLLVLLVLPVVRILSGAATTACGGPHPEMFCNPVMLKLLVPHNVLMAVCSAHLIAHPFPAPWPAAMPAARAEPGALRRRNRSIFAILLVLLLCNTAGYLAVVLAARANPPTAAMWMMMCLAVGGLLGFLFAVPRSSAKAAPRDGLQPNRNIEEISDWLTKIIVGLGLVNARKIADRLSQQADSLGSAIGTGHDFALAMIVYFLVAGFLEGYLIMRIAVQEFFFDAIGPVGTPPPAA